MKKGLTAVTSRAIAEAALCSEGAIYVHFPSRLQLILTVFEEALGEMLPPLRALEEQAGTATPVENLLRAINALQTFHARVVPLLCSMFAETELLTEFRSTLADRRKGPHGAVSRIEHYIGGEQRQGRIPATIDPEFAAGDVDGWLVLCSVPPGVAGRFAARPIARAVGTGSCGSPVRRQSKSGHLWPLSGGDCRSGGLLDSQHRSPAAFTF